MTDVEHAPVEQVQVRRGVYHDSVSLLRVSQAAADVPGIGAAQVAMATALNLDQARALGFEIPEDLTANDLVITLRATDAAALAADPPPSSWPWPCAPRSRPPAAGPRPGPSAAARANPDAGVVLLSVPGPAVLGERWTPSRPAGT